MGGSAGFLRRPNIIYPRKPKPGLNMSVVCFTSLYIYTSPCFLYNPTIFTSFQLFLFIHPTCYLLQPLA